MKTQRIIYVAIKGASIDTSPLFDVFQFDTAVQMSDPIPWIAKHKLQKINEFIYFMLFIIMKKSIVIHLKKSKKKATTTD